MVQIIRVSPTSAGWVVDCPGAAEPVHYLSGGKAETIARAMAARIAAASSTDVQVDILDRQDRKAGSYWFGGASANDRD